MMILFSLLRDRVFETSFVVFLFLNTLENILHYSIGKSSAHENDKENKKLWFRVSLPTGYDIVRFLIVMFIFAFLQGGLTYYFE